jgi:hypothetical protein
MRYLTIVFPAICILSGCGPEGNPSHTPQHQSAPQFEIPATFGLTEFSYSQSSQNPRGKEKGQSTVTNRESLTIKRLAQPLPSKLDGTGWVGFMELPSFDAFHSAFGTPSSSTQKSYGLIGIEFKKGEMILSLSCTFSDGSQLLSRDQFKIQANISGDRVYLGENLDIVTKSEDHRQSCGISLRGQYLEFKRHKKDGKVFAGIGDIPFVLMQG